MKKKNILKENSEYNRIIKNTVPFKYKDFLVFKIESDEKDSYKFGFSISKKNFGAVKRNKIKRQLKDIVDKKNYKFGFICIIMVKKSILNSNYKKMMEDLYFCFDKLNIVKDEKNEK